MPNAQLRATGDLVAVAWIKTIPGLTAAGVATSVPEDESTWGLQGFVQAQVVGGTPDPYLPAGRPVVQVDCWAVKPDSAKPLWNVANLVAEQIRMACYDHATTGRLLVLPSNYPNARVMSAYPLQEPRRRLSDAGGYARYGFDMVLHWVEVPS